MAVIQSEEDRYHGTLTADTRDELVNMGVVGGSRG